jgi:glycosyltransferase involved in cell wall biosynthesis
MRHVDADGMDQLVALWEAGYATQFPGLLLAYGSSPACHAFRSRFKAAGGRIAFLVHNEFFSTAEQILPADLLICPSLFIGERVGARYGIPYAICPPIVELAETLPCEHDPVFATFVNPQPIKGVHLFAALVAETLGRGMDCPFLVVGGRAGFSHLQAALNENGIRRKAEAVVTVMERCARPAEFLGFTRCLLVPSLHEAAGRVVVEAAACGIPSIVSDRGGLVETSGCAACVVPIPETIQPETRRIPAAVVKPWADQLQQLLEPDTYRAAGTAAKAHAHRYSDAALISPMLKAVAALVA